MLPREYAPRFALSAAELFHESDPWTREIFAMGEAVQGRIEAEVAKDHLSLDNLARGATLYFKPKGGKPVSTPA